MDLIVKPTELCNFKCTFCSSSKITENDNTAQLDLLKIFRFLDRYPDTQTIIVNGGDPLMMDPKYYMDIIEFLDRNNYPASICISRNASADDTVEDIRSRNKNTKMNHAQERNCFDNNIIADFIRFSVRTWIDINGEIHPDSEGIPHHPLFNADILGFNNKSHLYDEILTRIFLYSAASNSMVDAGHEEFENLYIKGSKVIIQPGEYYIKKKLFEGVKSNTLLVCDFLYGVLSNWPKKHSYNKTQSLVNALVRWYFEYNKELKSNFYKASRATKGSSCWVL